jgi:hypothetical protein
LGSPRLRRPLSLVKPTRDLHRALGQDFKKTTTKLRRSIISSDILDTLARDAERRQEKQGPIGRGGRPLGPQRTNILQRIFNYPAMKLVAKAVEDDEDEFESAIEETLEDAYLTFFELGGNAARRALGVRGQFQMASPAVAEALAGRANQLSGNVSGEVFERMLTVLADEIYLKGNSPIEAAEVLTQEFSWMNASRADLIARTEAGAITEEAQWMTYAVSGVPFKRWLTTLDGREREDHFEAHGQIKGMNEPYIVGGEELMHPLDPAGSAKQVCNCRCTEIPIVIAEQLFSDADVWDGRNDPDQFAKERLRDPDAPPRIRPPKPSDFEDLDFDLPEDEKREPLPIIIGRWLAKHLPGQHEQASHAGGEGGAESASETASGAPRLSAVQAADQLKQAAKNLDGLRSVSATPHAIVDTDYVVNQLRTMAEQGNAQGIILQLEEADEFFNESRQGRAILDELAVPIMGFQAEEAAQYLPREKQTLGAFDTPDALVQEARRLEEEIATRPREKAILIGPSGNVRGADNLWDSGEKGSYYSAPFTVDKTLANENVMTHNHPNSNTFSNADLNAAGDYRLREIRAVGYDGAVFRMSPGPQLQGRDRREQWKRIADEASAVRSDLVLNWMDKFDTGEMTRSEARTRAQHESFVELGKRGIINYEYDPKPARYQRNPAWDKRT